MSRGKPYYEEVWKKEGVSTWRLYPTTFGKISFFIGSGKKVLDIGCGSGVLLKQIHKHGNECFGVEISEEAARLVNQAGIRCEVAKVPPLPFEDNFFDVVIATELLEHIDEDEELVEEAKRVLKPGGWFVAAVPNDWLPPEKEPSHVRAYTNTSFRKLLKKIGEDLFVESFKEDFIAARWKDSSGSPLHISLPTLLGRVQKKLSFWISFKCKICGKKVKDEAFALEGVEGPICKNCFKERRVKK